MPVIEEVFDSSEVLERHLRSPARTEDEEKDLMKAVAERYSSESDSKWSVMHEAYNARAVEKRSKQAIKRAITKITSAKGPAESAPKEQSKRSQKREAANEEAKKASKAKNEEAKQRAMEDLGRCEDEDARLNLVRRAVCDEFWDCTEHGDYMDDSVERAFGIKMGDSVGDLVFRSWVLLVQGKKIEKAQVESSLAEGTLPASFIKWLSALPTSEHSQDSYRLVTSAEVLREIPWDLKVLEKCAKPGIDVSASVKVAARSAIPKQSVQAQDLEAFKKVLQEQLSSKQKQDPKPSPQKKSEPKQGHSNKKQAGAETSPGSSSKKEAEVKTVGSYTWNQQDDEVEVTVYVGPGVSRKDVTIAFKSQEVQMNAPVKMSLQLQAPTEIQGCSWTLSSEEVILTLEKKTPGKWPHLLKGGGK
mmetsp:Transcript_100849/g.178955  ORF Transcript_100849/g.178955 Transcript_100849/m.178955 type:complete len:417 (-) Transcript_100849:12-1262(-)